MPCITYESPDEICEGYERKFEHNSKLADTFCKTMQEIENLSKRLPLNFQIIDRMPEEALIWWEDHKDRDRKRIIKDLSGLSKRARGAAYRKLSPFEASLIRQWIIDTEVAEVQRDTAAQERAAALAKLSPRERELLKVK